MAPKYISHQVHGLAPHILLLKTYGNCIVQLQLLRDTLSAKHLALHLQNNLLTLNLYFWFYDKLPTTVLSFLFPQTKAIVFDSIH